MKNVPIKFRGKRVDNGRLAYGYYLPWGEYACGLVDDYGVCVAVEADSLAQLIGYDADGCEVYEGDSVEVYRTGKLKCTSTAKLTATVEVDYRDEDLNRNFDYDFLTKGAK